MKAIILSSLLSVLFIGFVTYSRTPVSAEPQSISYNLKVDDIDSEYIEATAYGVFDMTTGDLLLSKNADVQLPIASITKLFTAGNVLEKLSLQQELTVALEDVATEGRSGKLSAGETYKVHELLFPLLLESSNDAASVLERNIGKVSFADRTLADASGLSPQNKSTVRELSEEVRELYLKSPHIFDITTLKQYMSEQNGWFNNSPVFDLEGYKGGKHGYTEVANRTLVAVFSESSLGGREFGYVILGSNDLKSDINKLRLGVSNSITMQ